MNNLSTYIIEKLKLNKTIDNKYTLSEDINSLLKLFESIGGDLGDINPLLQWFDDNEVDNFIIYSQITGITNFNKACDKYKIEFKNSRIYDIESDTYRRLSEDIVGKDWKQIDNYLIYSNNKDSNNEEYLGVWGNKTGLIIDTFKFEILLFKQKNEEHK